MRKKQYLRRVLVIVRFLSISILVITILLLISNYERVIYVRKLILPFISIIFIICLILFSKTSIEAAKRGINLWIGVVFPSLFPFFVASEILGRTGFIKILGALLEPIMRPLFNVPGCGAYTLLMGITSGYPMGAKITSEMRKEGMLTKAEAERMLTFTNNSGPLFIFGAVAVGMFNMPKIGILLFVCHVLACITVGISFRFYKRNESFGKQNTRKSFINELRILKKSGKNNFGSLFGDAVKNSIGTVLAIGGFIIFFSVLTSMLLDIGVVDKLASAVSVVTEKAGIEYGLVKSIIIGIFEITTGANMASEVYSAELAHRIITVGFILGWAGFSVHSQVLGIIGHTDISIKPYLIGKFFQGILSSLYILIALKIYPNRFLTASAESFTYSEELTEAISFNMVKGSFYYSIHIILFLTIIIISAWLVDKLLKNSLTKN